MSDSSKVVFITGAARGIGAATARLLAERGDRLFLTDVDGAEVARLAQTLGPNARSMEHDVRDPAQWNAALDAAWSAFGRVDVVISNAGKLNCGFMLDLDADAISEQFDINVMGVVHGFRTAYPRLAAQGHGQMITIASVASFVPVLGQVTYCASKHAVRAIHYGFAQEHRDGPIAFSIVHPGAVDTPMVRQMIGNPAGALAFADKAVTAEQVAATIALAIDTRKRELMVPASNYFLRFVGVLPGLLNRAIVRAERRGLARMRNLNGGNRP